MVKKTASMIQLMMSGRHSKKKRRLLTTLAIELEDKKKDYNQLLEDYNLLNDKYSQLLKD
jgi:hypothetical protein